MEYPATTPSTTMTLKGESQSHTLPTYRPFTTFTPLSRPR